MPAVPPFASGQILLTLDDQPALLKDVDGGNIRAEVVTVDMGPQKFAQKHLSTFRYEPFTIAVGISMGKPITEWVKASFELSHTRKNGSVILASVDNIVQSSSQFRDALIESITIPALDASSKDPAFFTIRFQPEEVTYAKGDGAVVKGIVNIKQKKWLCSNFRLRVGDLACGRVTKIDSFTIKQVILEYPVGGVRGGLTKMPANIDFPNLKVAFPAADVGSWQEWFTDFVVRGNNDRGKELQGALELLDPTSQDVLGSIELSQIGIFSLKAEKLEANRDAIARYVAELYVEKMTFNLRSV